jgi:hypothetical protein
MPSLVRCAVATLLAGLVSLSAPQLRAEPQRTDGSAVEEDPSWSLGVLGKQASLLQAQWHKTGEVIRLRPRLLRQGTNLPIVVPPRWLDERVDSCVTLAVLGTQNVSFLLLFDFEDGEKERAWPVASSAGLAQITRCGQQKGVLRGLVAKMRSRRGVVEFVVATSKRPPRSARDLIAGRDAGPSQASAQVGRRPESAPLANRIRDLRARIQRTSVQALRLNELPADSDGRGSAVIRLDEGCHRLHILAPENEQIPPDIDARLSTLSEGAEVEKDEEQSGDAGLSHCVGSDERIRLEFSGASPGTAVTVLHAEWSLPEGIPRAWGAIARAHLSRAIFRTEMSMIDQRPLFSRLGVRGETTLLVATEPGACYQIIVAPIRGDAERISLISGAPVHRRSAHGLSGKGTSLSFCSETDRVPLKIEAAGEGLAWILGVWQRTDGAQLP